MDEAIKMRKRGEYGSTFNSEVRFYLTKEKLFSLMEQINQQQNNQHERNEEKKTLNISKETSKEMSSTLINKT